MRDVRELLSERVKAAGASVTMELAAKARALKAQGRDVISLTAGEPDMDTPAPIMDAADRAMRAGHTHYTDAAGYPELRAALARFLARDGVTVAPEAILPTPGSKQGIFYAIQALIGPGDGLIMPEPAWVSYRELTVLAGGEVAAVATDPDRDFRLEAGPIIEAGRRMQRPKLLILNYPSNPTGRVLTEGEIEAVAEAAEALDLIVLADEIYGKIVYPPHKFRRLATHPALRDRTITIDGFSKTYAMTGWRLGWLAGPEPLIAAMKKLQMHTATCPAAFVQQAAIAAIERCDPHVEDHRRIFERRRDLVQRCFGGIRGIGLKPAEGAFYAFLDARRVEDGDDARLCRKLLDEVDLALIPGSAFGAAGRGFVRMSFAAPDRDLERAADRMRKVLGT